MPVSIHHLELFTHKCEVEVRLNGVPIASARSVDAHTDHFAPPINPYLVGRGNVLEVAIAPAPLGEDEATDWSDARVEVTVRALDKGGILVPGGGGPAITELDLAPLLAERIRQAREDEVELDIPQVFLHRFDNDGVSFASELVEAEPYDDHEALLDYAIHVRDLFARGDVDGFLAEIAPKCEVWSRAYEEPVDFFQQEIRTGLETELLPAQPIVDFERDDVVLRPLAGGRMWSLERDPGVPLIQTPPDADEQLMQFRIVAAPRGGQLRIVR
ncbi:MAG: hypothetical protein KF729_25640 [Sandaracinaceae bacterium]|nr:hypothetical protein [Sandaracinaceae bacterium]